MKIQASEQRNRDRKTLCLRDIVISAFVVLIAAAAYAFMRSGGGGTAVISVDGKAVKEIPLSAEGAYGIDGFDMEFNVKNGAICVSHSDCHDKICEKTGYISGTRQTIVCLPNRVSVTIKNTDSAVDIVLN